MEVGIGVATELARGHGCLVTGDMGITNTTASAALVCAFTGASPAGATGRGTGVDDPTLARKVDVVGRAARPSRRSTCTRNSATRGLSSRMRCSSCETKASESTLGSAGSGPSPLASNAAK